MRNHGGIRAASKFIESTCDLEKEWRFGPPGILSRLAAAVFSLFFEKHCPHPAIGAVESYH
jgi:hypothetical protein